MKTKRPMIKETLGSIYHAFNVSDENGEFDLKNYEETVKGDYGKKASTTENAENTVVRGSGKDYVSASQTSSVENALEVLAFPPEDTARMRGDEITKYGVKSGKSSQRPFFAFGKVVKKVGGAFEYKWYPKCQLSENTDDIETSEESFSEQNDTLTIKAFSYNEENDKSYSINSEMSNFPKGITEDMFFSAPIATSQDLEKIIAEISNGGSQGGEETQEA